jgi:hypothetical protein
MPFFFLGLIALLATRRSTPANLPASRSPAVGGEPGRRVAAPAVPRRADTPPVLGNGTLGHTGQPAGLFWGLPTNTIWQVDSAYAAGDPFLMLAAADRVARASLFAGLAGLIRLDAQARSKAILQERTGNV